MPQGYVEHVNLTVTDIERSAALFERLLGWRRRWRGEAQNGGETIHVGEETTYLALYKYGYKNVYELAPLVEPAKSKLTFVVKNGAK